MQIPAWLKDTRSRAVLTAAAVVLVIVLYAASHHSHGLSITAPKLTLNHSVSLLAGTHAAATSTTATTAPKTSTSSPQAAAGSKSVDGATSIDTGPVTPVVIPNVPAQQLTASGGELLKSLVNIVCISGVSNIPSISGSGVMIDSRGIILTAAHVAQLFLLQDYLGPTKVECIVRTGSPARRAYTAEPIYVSPEWVAENPKTLSTVDPQGTGENDFALLAITGTATSTPLPTSFPAMPLGTEDPQAQEQVAIGSYGAQYLTAAQLNYSLYPILVFGAIQSRFTYTTNTVDLISVVGSAASQEGSSGGGIANDQGQIIGEITTSSIDGNLATRALNAITVNYIRRSYTADTGQSLDAVLQSESLPTLVAGFANESKILGAQIVNDLN